MKDAAISKDTASVYEQDFNLWLDRQERLLREGRLRELDIVNLAEEVADIGRSERRALESTLRVVLKHLLKCQCQSHRRTRSWLSTLLEHRERVAAILRDSPSLADHGQDRLQSIYLQARRQAALETGRSLSDLPERCPCSFEQLVDEDFLPE